jgi:hypothetical protein
MRRHCGLVGGVLAALVLCGASVAAEEWPAAIPRDAQRHELDAPPGGVLRSVMVQVLVRPASGAVLLYGGPGYDKPVEARGGLTRIEVPTDQPVIYARAIKGATSVSIETLGWKDRDR